MNEIQEVKSEYIDIIEQLARDIAKDDVSSYGKIAISEKLVEYIEKHKKWLADLVARANSMQKEYQATIDRVNLPTKLYNEFLDIAKKFNFPISYDEPIEWMPNTSSNCFTPTMTMSGKQDKLSRKDIDFMIKHLPSSPSTADLLNVKVPKEEQLSKDEIATYKKFDKTTSNKTTKTRKRRTKTNKDVETKSLDNKSSKQD